MAFYYNGYYDPSNFWLDEMKTRSWKQPWNQLQCFIVSVFFDLSSVWMETNRKWQQEEVQLLEAVSLAHISQQS